jgi:uncharacterized protein YxjI
MSSLLTHNLLVINQKAKLIEVTNEFKIRDENGNDVGFIRQEGQSTLKKVARFVGSLDQFFTHKLAVYDTDGTKVIELERPRKVFKSKVRVTGGDGRPVGAILQKNVVGKIRFDLQGEMDQRLGQIRAENWVAWDFAIVDSTEREVARITKKWGGFAKAAFTAADNYVVEIDPSVTGDLRLLVLASAAGVDTALKQDERGLSIDDFV